MKTLPLTCLAAVLVIPGLLFAGCAHSGPRVSRIDTPLSETLPAPPAQYSSPFLCNGELAEWARTGIEKGIGLQFEPVGEAWPAAHRYPDSRMLRYYDKPSWRTGVQFKRKQRHIAELAVRQIGGWIHIFETSDTHTDTAQELALLLYTKHRDHPRFAEALAVVMQVYPSLREEYYLATTSGRWFWYRGGCWTRESPWYLE
jgi:hypothetical protein